MLPQLFMMFKSQTEIPIVKISLLIFFSKFINMMVMFIPLKMLFVLSGSKNIEFLHNIETTVGREVYVGGMLAIVAFLYIVNVIIQVYKDKLINSQVLLIGIQKYSLMEQKKSHRAISKTYSSFCQILADTLLITVVLVGLSFVNLQYAVFYLLMVILYGIVIEQWAFPTHKTNLMKKLKIDSKQFIHITANCYFTLPCFIYGDFDSCFKCTNCTHYCSPYACSCEAR